jgi:hypothetical protein
LVNGKYTLGIDESYMRMRWPESAFLKKKKKKKKKKKIKKIKKNYRQTDREKFGRRMTLVWET